jgi:hypothetical protein
MHRDEIKSKASLLQMHDAACLSVITEYVKLQGLTPAVTQQ